MRVGTAVLRLLPVWATALTVAVWIAATPSASAQGAEEAPLPAGFGETVDVDVVNVDVHVTDADGDPITGLQPADFLLLEDGNPVTITNFYAFHDGRPQPVEGRLAASMPSRDAATSTGAETPPTPRRLPPDQRLHLVLFIDNLNISPMARNRVLRELRGFVEEGLQPSDRVMVVGFNGSVEVLQGFTDDPDELTSTLDRLAEESSLGGAASVLERRGILREIQQAQLRVQPGGDGISSFSDSLSFAISEARAIFAAIESYAQRHQNQTFHTLSALDRFVRSMAGLPGRKAVVYVSEGLSLRPGEPLFYAWEAKFAPLREAGSQISELTATLGATAAELRVTSTFRDLARLASSSGVTFYGLRPADLLHVTAEDGNWDLGALDSPGVGQAWSAGFAAVDSYNRGGSMRELADATGGFAITNAGTFTVALDRLRRDLDSYYSLGYAPSRLRDGERHRIEVRIPGRKVQIRHRESYRDKSPEERMTDRALAALLAEDAENPLGVSIEMLPPRRDEEGHQRLPVMVKIPLGNLVLVPGEELYRGRVTIHVGARDDEGRTSAIRSVLVPIQIPKAELGETTGRMAGHRLMLEMRPREHTVVIGVRDELGGVESTTLFQPPPLEQLGQG